MGCSSSAQKPVAAVPQAESKTVAVTKGTTQKQSKFSNSSDNTLFLTKEGQQNDMEKVECHADFVMVSNDSLEKEDGFKTDVETNNLGGVRDKGKEVPESGMNAIEKAELISDALLTEKKRTEEMENNGEEKEGSQVNTNEKTKLESDNLLLVGVSTTEVQDNENEGKNSDINTKNAEINKSECKEQGSVDPDSNSNESFELIHKEEIPTTEVVMDQKLVERNKAPLQDKIAEDKENDISDTTVFPKLPQKRPATFSGFYGTSKGAWPIRNYAKLSLPTNAYHGGRAVILLCSNGYGGKGSETTAEVLLFNTCFQGYKLEKKRIMADHTGHFGCENAFTTEQDGELLGDLMFGNNRVMVLTNDCRYGNLSDGKCIKSSKGHDELQDLYLTPTTGASNIFMLCSSGDGSCHALYAIRSGFRGEGFISSKLITGEDKWKFQVHKKTYHTLGPANSRYTFFCNQTEAVQVNEELKVAKRYFLQTANGIISEEIFTVSSENGSLIVLCSNSSQDDKTASAIYFISIQSGKLQSKLVSEIIESRDTQCSDIWKFETNSSGKLVVIGPHGPCRYLVVANTECGPNEVFSQENCLGTGEPSAFHGAVSIDNSEVSGIIDKPSDIVVQVNSAIVKIFKDFQLKKLENNFAFSFKWKVGEICTGTNLVRVYAQRKHVTTGETVELELHGSPKQLVCQKEGVIYAVNVAGPSYTAINEITYLAEHPQFASYTYDFNNGSRHKTYGGVKYTTNLPAMLNGTYDGFMLASVRSPFIEPTAEQKVIYDIEVPNKKLILKMHMCNRTTPKSNWNINGKSLHSLTSEEQEKQKDVLNHQGYRPVVATVPLEITNGKVSMNTSNHYAVAAFSILDSETYKEKTKSAAEIEEEIKETQILVDTLEPLARSYLRKPLNIVGWSPNLLKNASGEMGNMSHWNVSGDWKIAEGGCGTEKCFQTSHMQCTKYQEVDLTEHFTEEYLDKAPDIQVSEWYRQGCIGGGFYTMIATLLDADGNTITEYDTGEIGSIYKQEWQLAEQIFSNYGKGARSVAITSCGRDDKYWAGHYGATSSAAQIRVKRENTAASDDSFDDIELPETNSAEFRQKRDKIVATLLENSATIIQELENEEESIRGKSTQKSHSGSKFEIRYNKKKKKREKIMKRREIRVFVSSTFRDFKEERESIIKKAFREVNKACSDRGVFFTYVDLRWGITTEQTKDGKTIAICLQEVERCPYFLCLLGHRYGWCQKVGELDESLSKSFDFAVEHCPSLKWINEVRTDTSVTKLEIYHAVMNDIGKSKERSFFYLRAPPSERGLTDKAELKAQSAESDYHALKQKELRDTVISHQELKSRNFCTPEEVSELIKKDLLWCLDLDFPEGTQLTPLEREREAHQAFADIRCRVYIGREDYFTAINAAKAKKNREPFVLLGESGCGKSALVANWVQRYKTDHPDSFIFVHFIGSSAESASYIKLLRRLYEELKEFFEIEMAVPTSETNLLLNLDKWIRLASSTDVDIVIVLDALNQLNDGSGEDGNEHDLQWIPTQLPENVFILLSTLPGRAMNAVRNAGWETFKVDPLDPSQKLQIIDSYLEKLYTKSLSQEQKDLIVNSDHTNNPLYLRSLLDEVRIYGSFRTLTEKISDFLQAKTPAELFAKILTRLEEDFEEDFEFSSKNLKLVAGSTSAIWCSHRGMSEGEIVDFLEVPSVVWSPFFLSLVENLVNRNGILNFFHDHLRQAVEREYLSDFAKKKEYFLRLADFFLSRDLDDRVVDEVPFLLAQAGELEKLQDFISNLDVFVRLAKTEDGQFDLMKYWQKLGGYSKVEETYLSKLEEISESDRHGEEYDKLLDALGDFFLRLGLFQAAGKVYKYLVQRLEEKYKDKPECNTVVYGFRNFEYQYACNHPSVINALHQYGLVCEKQMDLKKGEQIYRNAIERQNRIIKPSQKIKLCEGLLGLSSVLHLQDDMKESKKMLIRCVELAIDVLGCHHHYVAAVMNKLGKVSYAQGRLDEAEGYFLRDLALTKMDVGMAHPRIAGILNDIALVYDDRNDPEAGKLYETSLAMLLDAFGPSHVDVAKVRFNLGMFYFGTNFFARAKYQFQKAYNVFNNFLGDKHPDTKASQEALKIIG